MSTAPPPDASYGVDALPGAPSENAQGKVYPSMYPLPGSSYPPLASPPNATLPAFTSFSPSVYNAGGVNYFPNHQGHNTIFHPAGFIPPTENPAPPMNDANFQAPFYPFYDMPVGTATSTAALLSSEITGHHEQSAQFTFQYPLPAQPNAAPAQQQWQGQHHHQVAQEDFAVEKPPQGPGDVATGDYQTHEVSYAALVELENSMAHSCSGNPHTACSGSGKICFDVLCAFVREYPHTLSPEQVAYLTATIAPEATVRQYTAGQNLQVDTGFPVLCQQGAASWETSSDWSTTASASTSEHSSPSGSFRSSPPSQLEAASSSMGTSSSSSTGRRQRSEDCTEDRPKKQRREGRTDTVDQEEHCEPCNNRVLDGRAKRRKKKKNSDGGEFICIFCVILGIPYRPFSRKDSLKRHVRQVHEIFQILFGVDYKEFKVLEPRRCQDYEDLRPLAAFCITLQSQARERGVEIKEEHDLSRLYPHIAAAVNHS